MGATTFASLATGKTAEDAFLAAARDAQWEHGHGGYTGTIAEKSGFIVFALPPRVDANKVIAMLDNAVSPSKIAEWERDGWKPAAEDRRRMTKGWNWLVERFDSETVRRMVETYNDKWGKAVCFQLRDSARERYVARGGSIPRGHKLFVFAGWASL